MTATWLVVLMLSPVWLMATAMWLWLRAMQRDRRRDPLTTELRRLPGAGLAARAESIGERLNDLMIWSLVAGALAAMLLLSRHLTIGPIAFDIWDACILASLLGFCAWSIRNTLEAMKALRVSRQGLRAELSAAQEIGAVLAGNNWMFHDIQADSFNIDHVVISPAGVFAVETKSRRKPPAGGGGDKVKVFYDGRALTFPGWVETEPIAQAGRQAKWLADYLRKATGESFSVTPVLALPGWWVENSAPISDGMVRAINPKNSKWLFLNPRGAGLDPAAIQRVSFAVEKLVVQESPAVR